MPTMKDALITVDEAAARIGKAPETVRRWIAAGTLPAMREGIRVMVPVAALDALQARPCDYCGQSFTPSRPTRGGRYCSTACADATRYLRNKPETTTTPPARPRKGPAAVDPRIRAALKLIRPV